MLDADGAAIGVAHGLGDIAKLHLAATLEGREGKGFVEIGRGEFEIIEGKPGVSGRRRGEGVEVCFKMTVGAVGVNEASHHDLLTRCDEVEAAGGIAPGGGRSGGASGLTERKALKEGAPSGVHVSGIIEPSSVSGFDGVGIGPGGQGHGVHFKT